MEGNIGVRKLVRQRSARNKVFGHLHALLGMDHLITSAEISLAQRAYVEKRKDLFVLKNPTTSRELPHCSMQFAF